MNNTYVFLNVRDRGRQKERKTQTDRQRKRQRQTERKKVSERDRKRERQIVRQKMHSLSIYV